MENKYRNCQGSCILLNHKLYLYEIFVILMVAFDQFPFLKLEAAHDREKELLREITDLQWRYIIFLWKKKVVYYLHPRYYTRIPQTNSSASFIGLLVPTKSFKSIKQRMHDPTFELQHISSYVACRRIWCNTWIAVSSVTILYRNATETAAASSDRLLLNCCFINSLYLVQIIYVYLC